MLTDFIINRIRQQLPYIPNEQQEELLVKLGTFLTAVDDNRLFLLRGYAGTGKTSIIAGMVRALNALQQKTVLLAPTGRAAKVISAYSGFPAYTIHKRIYRQRSMGEDSFGISYNTYRDTLFIVDEASMIANSNGSEQRNFGTGQLLNDLIEYVYSGYNCTLLLIGDDAQLPPVGQTISPALNEEYLQGYGLNVSSHTLTQVARQAHDSGILHNATLLREQIAAGNIHSLPEFHTDDFNDIHKLSGTDMLEELERAYREAGEEEVIVITRTNRRMNLYNQGIRARILWKEDEISGGDRIMVTRNNYFWTKQYEGIDFLANGDMFEITRLRHFREMYGFRFADACLHAVDYDWDIDVTLWLDTLSTDSPEANYQLQNTLVNRIAEDYPEIRSRKELWKKIMENPYYNALQVKHAYAVTCHKAQGGQWQRVFIDQGNISEEQLGTDYYRWLYTALTRAGKQVYLINFE
ncbi:MAG: AAA family ATPase [Paludibacter sp.]|nr:AAA family ATPase [Bacteroidales bacterium]MCM1068991.1 AAA family ATPase [Prevotella sp.]MCM1353654.1 AAA family ATPase [Bacteroides sp.]MCM1441997.1 AAA family ATPase [Muribaculum sp.]MCM1481547.1 AAA family ATPase [Paludibacter sp.]